jgi:HEAT repeat protein
MSQAADTLLAIAQNVNENVAARREAAAGLGEIGDGSYGQPLSQLLKDLDQGVAIAALKSLLRLIGLPVGEMSPQSWLGALQGALGSPLEAAREWAYGQVVLLFRALAAQSQTALDELDEMIDVNAPWASELVEALRDGNRTLPELGALGGASRKWALALLWSQADRDPRCVAALAALQ